MTLGERLRGFRKSKGLTQREFAEKLRLKPNSIAQIEGGRNTSDQTIQTICREFGVNEEWLRTGEGEMVVPKEADALDELVKQYGLSNGDYILIEKFLRLRPAERQAVISYMQEVVAALNAGTALSAPAFTPAQAEPDLATEIAELKRQNQEMAAKVAAMEEEDALLGLTDVSSKSPSVSVGNFNPLQKAKK